MREKLTILVVGGHPADVFDHCGGTMMHHVQQGDNVVCLALTQGLRIHDIVISEKYRTGIPEDEVEEFDRVCKERAAAKEQEVRDACGCLGITDVRFLSYDEEVMLETVPMIKSVAAVIRDVKPNIVITHYPYEEGGVGNHHATTGKIVNHAVELATTTDYENNIPAWRTAQVFYMIPDLMNQTRDLLGTMHMPFIPFYVDITDVVVDKLKALECMVSQQYIGEYARKVIEVGNGGMGHMMRTAYAEGFVPVHPDLYHTLPISQQRLDWANEMEIETRTRGGKMIIPFIPYE